MEILSIICLGILGTIVVLAGIGYCILYSRGHRNIYHPLYSYHVVW
ncbi:uncharacterized protein METZ01_LOCUS104106 [marine metagenome]|jgi:hypothetical protein|uniref:Uncharacterized protein n=1 Tax=marine metagenome TaxID=408172 RepID=A0A381WFL7_9ZZZZ